MRALLLFSLAIGLAADDTSLLPKEHLTASASVPAHLLAPSLAPGGVAGTYQDSKGPYRLLLTRMPTADKAAFLLLDLKKLMTDAHYLAHMGGYAGKKDGKEFYVFAKGPFVAAIEGMPEARADLLGRVFAAKLPVGQPIPLRGRQ